MRLLLCAVVIAAGCLSPPTAPVDRDDAGGGGGGSLRFRGNVFEDEGGGIDRVWIPAGSGDPAGALGSGPFTIELWLKLEASKYPASTCATSWFDNSIVLDREFFETPQDGNIGLAVYGTGGESGVAFGLEIAGAGNEVNACAPAPVVDGRWHHVAVTRDDSNLIRVFVDGMRIVEQPGPAGDGSVAATASTELEADLHLVLGGHKFPFTGSTENTYGWLAELRLSNAALYATDFAVPDGPLEVLPSTTALYRLDDGTGLIAANAVTAAGSDGQLRVGGDPEGPVWSNETPFD